MQCSVSFVPDNLQATWFDEAHRIAKAFIKPSDIDIVNNFLDEKIINLVSYIPLSDNTIFEK